MMLCATATLPLSVKADEGEVDAEFLYYQNVIQPRETGVYENDGKLYIQVREAYDSTRENRKAKRARVIFKAQEMLKQWAIEYSAPQRNQADESPDGVKFAKGIVAHYLPGWQFREWSPRFSMREFPHLTDDGWYVMGQSVPKRAVIDCIPQSFYRPFAKSDWNVALGRAVAAGLEGNDRMIVLASCCAWDASKNFVPVESVSDDEYTSVQRMVTEYLENSSLAKKMKEDLARVSGPLVTEHWLSVSGANDRRSEVSVLAKTNAVATFSVQTNLVCRLQTEVEIKQMGRSDRTQVTAVVCASDEKEVVERTVTTVIEEKRIVLRRVRTETSGTPAFERLFLSGGTNSITVCGQTPIGKKAATAFFAQIVAEQKEKAIVDGLRENSGDQVLWNFYGKCLVHGGDYVGGVICFRNALRLDPDYGYALVNLAETYEALKLRRLAVGLAAFARARSDVPWCIEHSERILTRR